MSESFKYKNEMYLDTKGIVHNKKLLSEILNNLFVDGDVYSTEEVKTNKVWIDGKPIYRKELSFITDSATYEMKTVNIGVSNIDLCFIGPMSAIISAVDKSIYFINAVRPDSNTVIGSATHNWFRVNPNRTQVAYVVGNSVASSQCYLELYYTKTTD